MDLNFAAFLFATIAIVAIVHNKNRIAEKAIGSFSNIIKGFENILIRLIKSRK